MKNLAGKRFTKLLVINSYRVDFGNQKYVYVSECQCDCGKIFFSRTSNLGVSTNSCGCMQIEWRIQSFKTHGLSNTKSYKFWSKMIERCLYSGDKNIPLSKEWRDIRNFYRDMGECPKGHALKRLNNSKGYCKSNCCWAVIVKRIGRYEDTNRYKPVLSSRCTQSQSA